MKSTSALYERQTLYEIRKLTFDLNFLLTRANNKIDASYRTVVSLADAVDCNTTIKNQMSVRLSL